LAKEDDLGGWHFRDMSTVLVTGGAGYIGSHVCKALAEAGKKPVCYDTLEKGHEWAVQWGPLERGDIGDKARLDEVFALHRPQAVIHLAGYIEVGESVRQPERYLHNNVTKSHALIDAAVRHGIDAFVFSSTCAVYGLPQMDLLTECHPIAPLSPYAESKAKVEEALAEAAGRGLRSAALRYFNAAGADSSGAIGEAHDPESHLMPLAIDAALGLGSPLTLLGTDYPTPDGSCVRDFVHVNDLADAHVRAIGWLARNGGHSAFNLGSGTGYSVRQVIDETARVTGRAVPYSVGPRRPGDSPKLVGEIAKSKRELGWSPTRNLATQIEDALRWRRKMPR
jgi:UDP-glucose-4-epimerase GalE